jgi:hypothetical protein
VPLDANDGVMGDALLAVTFDLAPFEWVEEGKGYREWLVPAAFINAKMSVRLVEDEEHSR